MRFNFSVEQALVELRPGGPDVRAYSPGLDPDLLTTLCDLAVQSGAADATNPDWHLFAYPAGRRHVAIAQVRGTQFHFQVWSRPTYEQLGDPFELARRLPSPRASEGTLETLEWPPEHLPRRTPSELLTRLKSSDSPLILGATQVLVDGANVRLTPTDPPDTLESVWQFLPDRTRMLVWPSTRTTPDTTLAFHASVMFGQVEGITPGTLTADQARDYPEGRYELAVQSAVESADQAELDRLLARRSSQDTLRLALMMVVFALIGAAGIRLIGG